MTKGKPKYQIILLIICSSMIFLGVKYKATAVYYYKTIVYAQYVATDKGDVVITDLKVGDRVLGYDTENNV